MTRFILFHAFPFDSSMWNGVAEILRAHGHEVISPDLPGFGDAALPRSEPDLLRMVEEVTPYFEGGPAVVVGCSMGGYVAMAIARHHPELIESLALVDTKATADSDDARANRERVAARAESGQAWSEGIINGLLGATSRAERPAVVAEVERALSRVRPESVAWAQRAMAARDDTRDALAHLRVAIVVIMGEEDTLSPMSEQELIVESSVNARLIVVPRAGHLSPLEAPGDVAQALLELC